MPKINLEKKNLTEKDLKNWDRGDLITNYLNLYEACQELLKENEQKRSLQVISFRTINDLKQKWEYKYEIENNIFTCFFCEQKRDFEKEGNTVLVRKYSQQQFIICGYCSKLGFDKANELKSNNTNKEKLKGRLQDELNYWENEVGLEQYLKNCQVGYNNVIKELRQKIKSIK